VVPVKPARKTLLAVGYIRVSTEEQAESGLSLQTQEQRIRDFCKEQGWKLVRIFIDDGFTGLDTNRKGYQEMLSADWEVAVAAKADRFNRSVDNGRDFLKFAIRKHRQLWSIAERRLDETHGAGDWFSSYVQGGLPEFESRQLGDRVRPAMEYGKDAGLHMGRAPVGLVWVRKEKSFRPTQWALALREDYKICGAVEAGRRNPYPDGELVGKPVSRRTVYRIVRNLNDLEDGSLVINKRRSPEGSHSKFEEVREAVK
jgi:DNA invertase Pin-like site-specific DNA recombinase